MSFFPDVIEDSAASEDALGKLGCLACPLKSVANFNPGIAAQGGVGGAYVLGSSPGVDDDSKGFPFAGFLGEMVRGAIGSCNSDVAVRYNNVVRTRTKDNQVPSVVAISCCRPSVVKDIEQTAPVGILGFGNLSLSWATGQNGIKIFRGRRMVVKIGKHRCWYYPIYDPAFVSDSGGLSSIEGLFFTRDIKNALTDIAKQSKLPDEFSIAEFNNQYSVDFKRLSDILDDDLVAFDVETYSSDKLRSTLRPFGQGAVVLSISFASTRGTISVPVSHPDAELGVTVVADRILDALRGSRASSLVAHNLSFDLEWILCKLFTDQQADQFLTDNRWRLKCTMAQAYVLDNRSGALSLNVLCALYFGVNMKLFEQVNVKNLFYAEIKSLLRYNAIDAFFTAKLFAVQQDRIVKLGLSAVADEQHWRIPTLVLATRIGLLVDLVESVTQKEAFAQKLVSVGDEISALPEVLDYESTFNLQFDLNSPQALARLFTKIGISLPTTDKGNKSTSASALQKIEHVLAKKVLEYRQIAVVLRTFIRTIAPGGKNLWADNRLHPQFNACRTATRRLSSSSPNGQNFPKRRNEFVRNQIVAPAGHTIVSVDFGQIEARLIAADSQDKVFVDSVLGGLDIHASWASRIVDAYPKWRIKDKKERRNTAKSGMVFASFYLASSRTVAEHLGIPQGIAQHLLDEFWEEFSGVKKWQLGLIEQYKRRGYLELCSGFRCRGVFTDYQIVNYRIQGTASDIVVGAMTRLSEMGIQAVLNIHDDLVFYIKHSEVDEKIKIIAEEMLLAPSYMRQIPLGIEISAGERWGSMCSYER